MFDWLGVLFLGLIAGWIAGSIVKGSGFGLIGNVIVGVLGAAAGRFLFDLIGLSAYGFTGKLVMAVAGALALLFLWTRLVGSKPARRRRRR